MNSYLWEERNDAFAKSYQWNDATVEWVSWWIIVSISKQSQSRMKECSYGEMWWWEIGNKYLLYECVNNEDVFVSNFDRVESE